MVTYSDDNEILLSCTKDMVGKIIIPNGVKRLPPMLLKIVMKFRRLYCLTQYHKYNPKHFLIAHC